MSFAQLLDQVQFGFTTPRSIDEVARLPELVAVGHLVGISDGRSIADTPTAVFEVAVDRILLGEVPNGSSSVYVEVPRSPGVPAAVLNAAAPKAARMLLLLQRAPNAHRCNPPDIVTSNEGAGLPPGATLMMPTQAVSGATIELKDGTERGLQVAEINDKFVGLPVWTGFTEHVASLQQLLGRLQLKARKSTDPNPLVPACGTVGNVTTVPTT